MLSAFRFQSATTLFTSVALGLTISQMTAIAQDSSAPSPGSTGTLINISTPDLLHSESFGFRADIRTFGGDEDTTYYGAALKYGMSDNWELGFSSSFAPFQGFLIPGSGVIFHGGTDMEITAKYGTQVYGKYGITGQVGVDLPNTPAQQSTHLTLGAAASITAEPGIDLYVNPRTVLTSGESLFGIGVGAKIKMGTNLTWIGDYTAMVNGYNTLDTTTGNPKSLDIYGIALRYTASSGNIFIDLGWTNGAGVTTATSLTPGLGNSSAWYLSINFKQ